MGADAYLPVVVKNVPCGMIFDGPQLKPKVAHYVRLSVVRISAGAEFCHVWIDVQRPYFAPRSAVDGGL